MLRNVSDLRSYAVRATDGVIGKIDDLFFDDEHWAIRYFVVDTGGWLSGRKVLMSPLAVGHPDWMGQLLPVAITRAQVKDSPDVDTEKPVSRQHEIAHADYYGEQYYWAGAGMWGPGAFPGNPVTERAIEEEARIRRRAIARASDDSHLRSCKAMTGHPVHAIDGDIGHLEDFLVDEHTWAIRYLIVATSNYWWGGRHVLVAPQWIEDARGVEAALCVDLTRQAVKDAPRYDSAAQLDRQQEQGMYEHYGRPGYWTATKIQDAAAAK